MGTRIHAAGWLSAEERRRVGRHVPCHDVAEGDGYPCCRDHLSSLDGDDHAAVVGDVDAEVRVPSEVRGSVRWHGGQCPGLRVDAHDRVRQRHCSGPARKHGDPEAACERQRQAPAALVAAVRPQQLAFAPVAPVGDTDRDGIGRVRAVVPPRPSAMQPSPLTVVPSPSSIGSWPAASRNTKAWRCTSASYTPATSPRPESEGSSTKPTKPLGITSLGVIAMTAPSALPCDVGATAPSVSASKAAAAGRPPCGASDGGCACRTEAPAVPPGDGRGAGRRRAAFCHAAASRCG